MATAQVREVGRVIVVSLAREAAGVSRPVAPYAPAMVTGDVDVVVVAYRSKDIIHACLDAVRTLEGVVEVLVVDHGDDGSGGIAAALGARTVSDPSNPGFGAGVNRGLSLGTSPLVLVVNPDARVVASGIEAGKAVMRSRPDVAVVQGVIGAAGDLPDRSQGRELGPVHLWGRALGLRRLLNLGPVRLLAGLVPALADSAHRMPAATTEVQALAATAWLARRAALEGVGGFDERYFLYGEDLDLCRRLRAEGWRLVAIPDPWAVHAQGGSSASSWSRELQWWQGTMTFAATWWSGSAWAVAMGAALVRWLRLSFRRPSHVGEAFQALIVRPRYERVSRRSL